MKKIILFAVLSCSASLFAQEIPKNVILMIGDGMGVSQLTAGRIATGGLEIERLNDAAALVTTFSASSLVTDSAAAGTAMATGYKTINKALSVDADGNPLKTVAETAKEKDKAVGLVSNCSLTHATPASFAVHVTSRKMDEEIARQMTDVDVDVLFGGGRAWFLPQSGGGARTDGTNLLKILKGRMPVAETAEEFDALGASSRAAALLYPKHPPHAPDREVALEELTAKALEILFQNTNGFFLMVEGSQIDWAGHNTNASWLVEEMVDFDDAVGVVADFAESRSDTLVVVTADHETGGFTVHGGSLEERTVTDARFTAGIHSAAMVPLFAEGPGADAFGGIMDNTDIGQILMRYVEESAGPLANPEQSN